MIIAVKHLRFGADGNAARGVMNGKAFFAVIKGRRVDRLRLRGHRAVKVLVPPALDGLVPAVNGSTEGRKGHLQRFGKGFQRFRARHRAAHQLDGERRRKRLDEHEVGLSKVHQRALVQRKKLVHVAADEAYFVLVSHERAAQLDFLRIALHQKIDKLFAVVGKVFYVVVKLEVHSVTTIAARRNARHEVGNILEVVLLFVADCKAQRHAVA